MLSIARENAPDAKFLEMNLLCIDLLWHSFDGVWCCASLLHVGKADAPGVIGGFNAVLKDGGVLFVALKEGSGGEIAADAEGNRCFFAYYCYAELKHLLAERGFEVLKLCRNTRDSAGTTWLSAFCTPEKSETCAR